MDADTTARPEPAETPKKPFWKPERFSEIGVGRLVRLGLMIVILLGALGAWWHLTAKTARAQAQREAQVTEALEQARGLIGLLTPDRTFAEIQQVFQQVDALLVLVEELDPGNAEAQRLAVPLCYATGYMDDAVGFFNNLNVFAIAEEMDPALFKSARELDKIEALRPEARSPLLTTNDKHYIRASGLLWALAQEITAGAEDDAERARRLCRWMAMHILPDPDGLAADPYIVVLRGYGTPAQTAWTYAELARQLGLRARIVAPSTAAEEGAEERFLVQVSPAGGTPLLVDPFAGVPVMDVGSGEPLGRRQVLDNPARLAGLRELPGGEGIPAADRLREVELLRAVAVESCFRRVLVFDHLLAPLKFQPEIGLHLGGDEQDALGLWNQALAIRQQMHAEDAADRASLDFRYINPAQPGRTRQLRGLHLDADEAYAVRTAEMAARAKDVETEEAAATLREALEFLAFATASNALDGGDAGTAGTAAQKYLEEYPDGRWRPLVLLIQAEAFSAAGEDEKAADIWQALTGPRGLYGALRARGLITGSASLVTPAEPSGAAAGDQPEAP